MTKVNLDKIQAKGDGNIVSVVGDATLPNGAVVALGELLDGERELFKAVAPEAEAELLLVAAPEVKYDETQDQLDFETKAGTPVRAYHLKRGDMYQAEHSLFEATPTKGQVVTGNATYGYKEAVGTEVTKFKVEALTKFGYDRRDMALLRVL
ncbi:hypothetical protein [Sporosarcina sp. FSL W7-1283]|uniref:hypothetical protein n=1 Tax=Sporosarcina sp. FSL W7-1283 TaxID=2921560 RepID=UPI0030FB7FAD